MFEHTCSDMYQVIDEREGTIVCTNCGKVLDTQLYVDYEKTKEPSQTSNFQTNDKAYEILSRLNLTNNTLLLDEKGIEVKDLYQEINKQSAVTLKEFCAATGLTKNVVVKTNRNCVCSVDIFKLLDKYCSLLEVPFTDYTVIKEKIQNKPYSGHPPLTVIGYYIHTTCKKQRKITIKKICETLGISSISIQRFRKHEFSHRC